MEEIRRAGQACYDNMSSREKNEVFQMFTSHDANRDGWISFQEVFNQFAKSMPTDKIVSLFSMIDTDGNGFLDFSEFVTLYYVIKSRPLCNCCKEIVTGLYFCCVRCWEMHVHSGVEFQPYELCSECYYTKSFRHEHTEFRDNLLLLRSGAQQSRREEKALEAGRLYFKSLTGPDENVARKVFREMDQNGDGRVHSSEVINFLIRKGVPSTEVPKILDKMGMMQSSYLTLEDVVAFWYVMVMRPVCNTCSYMITGSFYSCVPCFHASRNGGRTDTYDLCPGCYSTGNYRHQHGVFVDNYALLHLKNQKKGESWASGSTGTQGTVMDNHWPLWKKLVFIAELVGVANAVTTVATASSCSIM
ncbi:hypothetical protein AAC387_Pa01g3781 [Persea americana]